ncbi:MAG: efflux RND transporter periplasmic adaptor subunit [Myxococcales bacterium]
MSPRSSLLQPRLSALAAATGFVLLACESAAGPKLPPLEGPGAAPAPVIAVPAIARDDEQAADSAHASTGTLRAKEMAAIGPKEAGVITSLPVAEGDRVRKGQLLFRLDSAQVELAIEQAKAALASAKVQADSAQTLFDRVKALRERGAATPDAYDQAKAQVDSARSLEVQAQASLDLAAHRLNNMSVSSPIDGIVTEKRMNLGESATLMPPSVVLVIQNVDMLELRARLPEAALAVVKVGSTVSALFPAIGIKRDVQIKRLAPTVDPRSRTIEIIGDVPNRDHRLLAGMLVEVAYGPEAGEQQAKATP